MNKRLEYHQTEKCHQFNKEFQYPIQGQEKSERPNS